MKNIFTFWPEEVNALPKERKQKVIGGIIGKSKKLQVAFILLFAFEMITISVLAYVAIFVYQIDLERGSLETIYFVIAGLAMCGLSIILLKIIARSEYDRLKPELF